MTITNSLYAKNYDNKNVICADEVGPLFEFLIPNFEKDPNEKKFDLKIYDKNERNKYKLEEAVVIKKNSPIDRSYFFYYIKFNFSKNVSSNFFEFFPPSHLIMKNKNTLVCWEP